MIKVHEDFVDPVRAMSGNLAFTVLGFAEKQHGQTVANREIANKV